MEKGKSGVQFEREKEQIGRIRGQIILTISPRDLSCSSRPEASNQASEVQTSRILCSICI